MSAHRPEHNDLDDLNAFGDRLSTSLHTMAQRAPAPRAGTSGVLARVAARRRARLRAQAIAGACAVVLVGGAAIIAGTRDRGGDLTHVSVVAGASSDSTIAKPRTGSGESGRASQPATTSIARAATAAAPFGWASVVGVHADPWTLRDATGWNALRSSGWPTPYQRTSTWSDGIADPTGAFIVVQSDVRDVAPPPSTPNQSAPGAASTRAVDIRDGHDGVLLAVWREQVADRGAWTMVVRGVNVSRDALVRAAQTATWDDTAERWVLDPSTGLTLQSWQDRLTPRELTSTYVDRGSRGRELRISEAATLGRFGADLATLRDRANASTRELTVRGHGGFAAQEHEGGGWDVIWTESATHVVRVLGPAGLDLDDLVAMLVDVPTSSMAIATGS